MNDHETSEIADIAAKLRQVERDWPKLRGMYLVILICSLALSIYMITYSVRHLFEDRSVLDHFKVESKPEDMSTELWLVAEVRRTVALQEVVNQGFASMIIELMVGVILGLGAIFILILLALRWKDGGREMQLIRLLLACYEKNELA